MCKLLTNSSKHDTIKNKETLVSLCKNYPEHAEYYKTLYKGKVDGVLDLLSCDDTLTIDEYVKVTQELKESFEREVNEMLK